MGLRALRAFGYCFGLIALHVTERALVRRVIVVVVCWWNLNDAGRAKLGGERRS